MQKGANVNAKNGQGATPLHWSVVRGSLPCMEALLRAGANKEAQDSKGYRVCVREHYAVAEAGPHQLRRHHLRAR